MSLCYDFQKWTILTLGLVAVSLSVGLIQYAHGLDYSLGRLWISPEENQSFMNGEYDTIIKYCLEHAGDKLNPIDQLMGKELNPVKDLVDNGLVAKHFEYDNCESVNKSYNDLVKFLKDHPEVIK